MAHNIVALMLLLVFAAASQAGAMCAGWAGSASERMACCQREGSDCVSLSPDDCCAAGEQRQNLEKLAGEVPAGRGALSGPGTLVGMGPRAVAADPCSLAERPATHLLDSVFRI